MAYYKTPEEMYRKRAENSKHQGNRHWAMAKSGEGTHHYGQAKSCYKSAAENQRRATETKKAGATWGRK